MTSIYKTAGKMILLAGLTAVGLLSRPIPAHAAPYCAFTVSYYSDDTFTTVVGTEDTTNCIRAVFTGNTNNTGNIITEYFGACDDAQCSSGECSCANNCTDVETDGVWNYGCTNP